jgi:hypothetical protein
LQSLNASVFIMPQTRTPEYRAYVRSGRSCTCIGVQYNGVVDFRCAGLLLRSIITRGKLLKADCGRGEVNVICTVLVLSG